MDAKTRMLLICGALAGPLFTTAWFLVGLVHEDYDPMRHAISSLSVGKFGWAQDANFILTGILTLAFAFGLWATLQSSGGSIWGPLLVAAAGGGFIGDGLFITDPLNGYPPGAPVLPVPPTRTGWLHLLFAALVFGLPAAGLVLARLFNKQEARKWAIYSAVTAIIFILLYLITIAGFLKVDGLANYAGLLQRISLTIVLAWLTLISVYLLKTPSNSRTMGRN